MREVVLDTETTGLDPKQGDRVIEVGCVELVNYLPTGRTFHRYLNPDRGVSLEAARLTGLEQSFLVNKPRFAEIAGDLLAFLGDSPIVAHNGEFDLAFLNAELRRAGRKTLPGERLVDTLVIAGKTRPGGRNSLDALMSRYQIDARRRTLHGALLDAELLAEVYIELMGGRQPGLDLLGGMSGNGGASSQRTAVAPRSEPLPCRVSEAELTAHREAVESLGETAIWNRYLGAGA